MIKFNEKFSHQDFLDFLNNFLPEDFLKKEEDVVIRKERYKEITKATILGFSESLDLYVLEMDHNRENDPRISIATDAFKILADHWIHKALVVFKNQDSENYRLSYLTISLDLNDRNKAVKKYSNARRYSFYLGPNAKVNTPTKFLISNGKVADIDDLKRRFSLEVVNKEFYKLISESFIKLVGGTLGSGKNTKVYKTILRLPSVAEQSQVSLEFAVRLIGRVIFCWFLREKKSPAGKPLVPKDLVSLTAVNQHSDYYHKVLEPIFFEVLNKRIQSRKEPYSNESFALIPYLNGGLFSPYEDDFFSHNEGRQAINHNTVVIPDEWFVELFKTLEIYNFTIDENTSFDEELSIDPEMLGRIFENLLAEINPETGESARKNTGSYYTPRVIVDYMVDESLVLYLKTKTCIDENKLRAMVSYDLTDDVAHPLSFEDKEKIIDALENLKILDPACGSGAFPIGALQKVVFILQRIDSDGKLWFKKQLQRTSPELRRIIEREFAHKNFDYIRKLGIIRENIYGVDVQPIATEIARLRCFLTLVVDERVDDALEDRGIEPLPNLDFKFVTANSLIGLPQLDAPSDKPQQKEMFDDREKIDELKFIREQYFTASGIEREQLKTGFVTAQKKLVDQLIKEHGFIGLAKAELTQKLTDWEPFGNKSSSWFDPEWMFGIKDGFDITIGNPPYVRADEQSEWNKVQRKAILDSQEYETLWEKWDLYVPFIERSYKLLRPNGVSTLIVSDAFCHSKYAQKPQAWFLKNARLLRLDFCADVKIFDAAVYNMIYFFQHADGSSNTPERRVHNATFGNVNVLPSNEQRSLSYRAFFPENTTAQTFACKSIQLDSICYVTIGMVVNAHENLAQGEFTMEDLVQDCQDVTHPKRFVEGKHLAMWLPKTHRWIEWGTARAPALFRRQTFPEIYETPEKVLVQRSPGPDPKCCYDNQHLYFTESTVSFVPWHALAGVRNNSLKKTARYHGERPLRPDLPIREELEETSKRFSIKYLLAAMNSSVARNFLRVNRRSNIHLYPDDWKKLPIPDVSLKKQTPIVDLVDKILVAKRKNLNVDISILEVEVDQMVSNLYGLTKEEIEIVEGRSQSD